MMRLGKYSLVLMLFIFIVFNAEAAFEHQHWGARTKALSQAVTADWEPTFWNPATLAGQGRELTCAYTDLWNLNIPVSMAGVLLPLGEKMAFGLRGNIFHDEISGVKEQLFSFAWGITPRQGFKLGLTVNNGSFRFQEVSGKQTTLDLGMIKELSPSWQGGVVMRSFWSNANYTTGRQERAPRQLAFGLAGEITPQFRVLVDCVDSQLRLGVEKQFAANISLQAGWQRDIFSFGLEVTNGGLSCQYAFSPEPMGNGHLLSLAYNW